MKVTANGLMFLEARKGDFKPENSEDTIHFQNATFFQKDGGTFTLKVAKDLNVDEFQATQYYDCVIDFNEISYGRGKAFTGRILDFVPSAGGEY